MDAVRILSSGLEQMNHKAPLGRLTAGGWAVCMGCTAHAGVQVGSRAAISMPREAACRSATGHAKGGCQQVAGLYVRVMPSSG